MGRPKKATVKGPGTAVRLDDDEKRYLTEAAKKDSPPGTDLGLSVFLRSAGHHRAAQLLGVTFEKWMAKKGNGR